MFTACVNFHVHQVLILLALLKSCPRPVTNAVMFCELPLFQGDIRRVVKNNPCTCHCRGCK